MIIIDGSEGEGGGQVVRNALALSLVTGQPFRVEKARANRSKPGLMRQHVTAIEAACAIGNADCEGAAVGASDFTFRPGRVVAGVHRFAVGTAGSTSLVLQTILLPLLLADGPSRVVLEGGTHNVHAPPFDFLAKSFLPLVERMGPRISATLVRHGFYPSGGGRIEVDIDPAPLQRIELVDRGEPVSVRGRAVVASLPRDIAEREIASARKDIDWSEDAFVIEQLPSDQGPGNILLLEAEFAHHTEVTCGFGQLGVSAQSIGRNTASRMAGYIRSGAFAGPYLADQLLLPMALAGGGAFTTVKPSQHALTAANIIRRFLDRRIVFDARKGGVHHVEIC
jgi:RNA 3'-terminal phosphate cyclase (ATP)